MNREPIPAILLVEDDPTTRAYLQALTETLPARVDTAATMAQALQAAQATHHDLWLVDANLPDGDGATLLARLRAQGLDTPAVAHTAARDASELDALLRAGFMRALSKPVDAATWRDALTRALRGDRAHAGAAAPGKSADTAPATWDDAAATRALGGPQHIASLRGLFLAELPGQLAAVQGQGAAAMQAQLHRLRASCALVGAARLDAAVRALQAAPGDSRVLQAFVAAAQDALAQPVAPGG